MTGQRASGLLEDGGRYGCYDHAAAGYASDDERRALATAWLRDGLAGDQRAIYVGEAFDPQLLDDDHADLAAARAAGALVVATASEVYALDRPLDPSEQLSRYEGLVARALADGFRGIRVVADVTPLVLDPDQRAAHIRWEHVADRFMAVRPMAALCLVDTRRVVADAVVHAHPLRDAAHADFGVYATAPGVTTIEGELDALAAAALAEVLEGIPVTDTVLDLEPLAFVDGRAAWLLQRELDHRRRAGHPLTVLGASAAVHRLWDLCGFDPDLLAPS